MNTDTDIEIEIGSVRSGGRRLSLRTTLTDIADSRVKPYTAEESERLQRDLHERIAAIRRRPWRYRLRQARLRLRRYYWMHRDYRLERIERRLAGLERRRDRMERHLSRW